MEPEQFPPVYMATCGTPDQDFWEEIFKIVITVTPDDPCAPEAAAEYADEALEAWRKRWGAPNRGPVFPFPPVEGIKIPGPTLDTLMYAQKELEAARDRLHNLEQLRDHMPKDFADAWWGVEGAPAEKRVQDAEQWVKNIQEQIEKNADPAPPASGGV